MNRINGKIEWALNEDAKHMVDDMVAKGFDRDLAIEIMTEVMGETAVFELPDEEDGDNG